MAIPDNIRTFDAITAWLLDQLYSRHPEGLTISADDLPKDIRAAIGSDPARVRDTWVQTWQWLAREGFIHVKSPPPEDPGRGSFMVGAAGGITLTLKGFGALRAVPASLASEKTVGEKLSDVVKAAGGDLRSATVSAVVSTILSGAARGFG